MKLRTIVVLVAVLFASSASAGNAWYKGKVRSLLTSESDGSFMVYYDNSIIDDTCASKRVLFTVNNMGLERTKLAYAMALTALTTGKEYGLVIDIPSQGSVCYASISVSQGAGIWAN